MGFDMSPNRVEGNLFNERGKWKYTVCLNYDSARYEDVDVQETTRQALRDATMLGISGVSLREIPTGWHLVVLEPYVLNSYPFMVIGT